MADEQQQPQTPQQPEQQDSDDFLDQAGGKERGIIAEFVDFMAENRAWWMTPILVVLGLVGVLLVLGATPAGAFLYALW